MVPLGGYPPVHALGRVALTLKKKVKQLPFSVDLECLAPIGYRVEALPTLPGRFPYVRPAAAAVSLTHHCIHIQHVNT
ncbi:hypothetical protein P3T37_005998 [Kitasatospora sp. MAA4]|nr:hypothetical protein [Kitasatospora sp. MAA4]